VGMDEELVGVRELRFVLARVDAVHRADVDAGRVLRTDARFADDVGHGYNYISPMNTAHWLAWCLVAQMLPAGPIELGRGTVTIAGDVPATFGAKDQTAFFNFTDYENNALRMFRVSFSGMWRPTEQFAFVTEIRSEDLQRLIPYALYARVRPWKGRAFDV